MNGKTTPGESKWSYLKTEWQNIGLPLIMAAGTGNQSVMTIQTTAATSPANWICETETEICIPS